MEYKYYSAKFMYAFYMHQVDRAGVGDKHGQNDADGGDGYG